MRDGGGEKPLPRRFVVMVTEVDGLVQFAIAIHGRTYRAGRCLPKWCLMYKVLLGGGLGGCWFCGVFFRWLGFFELGCGYSWESWFVVCGFGELLAVCCGGVVVCRPDASWRWFSGL